MDPKEAVVYGVYPRCYKAESSNPKGITYTTASKGVYVAYTTVDCLPPITGREMLNTRAKLPLVTPLGLGSLENNSLKSMGYVIERTRGTVD